MNGKVIEIKPISGQVRYRSALVPPNYSLVTVDVSARLAAKLAEIFNLKSRDLLFNQGTLSTAYLSFRHFVPAKSTNRFELRYLDVTIGADQIEILFVNPPDVASVKEHFLKICAPIMEMLKPTIVDHYFEVSLDCSTEGRDAKGFLADAVSIESAETAPSELLEKGFSLRLRYPDSNTQVRISLESSITTPDGIFLFLTYAAQKTVTDLGSLKGLVESAIQAYRNMQPLANILVLEEM